MVRAGDEMIRGHYRRWIEKQGQSGFSLLEVMVAAFLLLVVFFGLAHIYTRGRVQMNHEEDRRRATAVLQARLDGIRRDYSFATLASLNGATNDTTYNVDGWNYTVHHVVSMGVPEPQAATVELTLTWAIPNDPQGDTRSMSTTTILGRSMPLAP
jgi:prepilin-type N-terminal cleavage/methylation domain-containing protein